MTSVALFHSVLGVRPGVHAAADLLRSHGHTVRVVDQYDGRVFDNYDEAGAFATNIGYPTLMQAAARAVEDLPGPFVCAGFSNGGGMSMHVAANNPAVHGVVLFSGAMDPAMIGVTRWSATVPVEVHYTVADAFRDQGGIDSLERLVKESGARYELFDYPGHGHLFTDPSLPDEYDPASTSPLWNRTVAFLDRIDTSSTQHTKHPPPPDGATGPTGAETFSTERPS